MKIWIVYIFIFGFGLLSIFAMVGATPSPETLIQGQWEELTWEYEKVDKTDNESVNYKHISEDVKKSIGKNLIIHEAETWNFLPNGKLRLTGNNIEKMVEWRIKGRGNILQLTYEDDIIEHYILTELTETEMHLNFDTDIQARGIAKLTFQRPE